MWQEVDWLAPRAKIKVANSGQKWTLEDGILNVFWVKIRTSGVKAGYLKKYKETRQM